MILKVFGIIKQVRAVGVLAIFFVVFLFYIGMATFPFMLITIGTFQKDANTNSTTDYESLKDMIDYEYLNMLTFQDHLLQNKGAYINLNGLAARLMGQRYMNGRVKLDNGHLASIIEKVDVTPAVTQLTELFDKQTEKGKDFLFVLAPSQVPKYEDILPKGYDDYSNSNADELLDRLRDNGIPTLDLREEAANDNMGNAEIFFKTDHHWKPETGFWAYTKIIDYLRSLGRVGEIASKYTDINEYNIELYKNWFLGSSGQRTGSYYAGVDDFALITPKFPTNMSVEISSASIQKQGDFAEVAYDREENKCDYFTALPYKTYGSGDKDFTCYRNESAPVDLKILSLGDSFGNVVFPFLPLIFHTCDELDMRWYKGNFEQYYNEFEPDIMIVLVNTKDVVQLNTTYDFFGE